MTPRRLLGILAAIVAATSMISAAPSRAQSGSPKSTQQPAQQRVDLAKERRRQQAEYAEAAKVLKGPAGNPECVWVGRRVITLMWRDDLDTAFRHLELYDRFGCPKGHIQAVFRCVVRQGDFDPKMPESLRARVHSCWIDPAQKSAATAVAPPASSASAPARQKP
jgi:hypothetical protein